MDPEEARRIGREAYIYLYPLVLMDITRLQTTNVEAPAAMAAPMNVFGHAREYPDPSFRAVVRPNFDTLYSTLWMDLMKEPVIVSVPNSRGRFHLLETIDMWTDVLGAPGTRTTGNEGGDFAFVPPGWTGELPQGVTRVSATTSYLWMIGRTQTNGPQDYDEVHKFQEGMKVTPLSQWGKAPSPMAGKVDPKVDMKMPPMEQVEKMPARRFFEYAAQLMKLHPPHHSDHSQVWRLQRVGMVPGEDLDFHKLEPAVQEALQQAVPDALEAMQEAATRIGRLVNGWIVSTDTMGVYGNYYLKRAAVALVGLGANEAEDAVYPMLVADADGRPAAAGSTYALHFERADLPPVEAFWSVTLYDTDGFPVPNPAHRQNLSSWMPLTYNRDGSLDLYFQADSPGKDKEPNWLPTPREGGWNLTMRLYAPKREVLDGEWNPPPLRRVAEEEAAIREAA